MDFETPVYKERIEKKESDLETTAALLEDYCERNGNPIKIYQAGKNREQEANLHPSLRTLQIDDHLREVLQSILEKMLDFVHAPIFTDSFSKDHSSRRVWEREHILRNAELNKYYQRNRLNVNNWIVFRQLNDVLQDYRSELPAGIVNKANAVVTAMVSRFSGNEALIPDTEEYNQLSDEEKIALMPKIENVTKTLIKIISEEKSSNN